MSKPLSVASEAKIERMLVLKLAPSLGLVLAQQVVELMKLLFAERR
jgi:hypothetical protein